jgi:hypothetical protein
MALLVGITPLSGGVYWQLTDASDPGVLTIIAPRAVAEDAAVPYISLPEGEQEAWTLDLDALREHTEPRISRHFPAWVSGRASATPSEVGPGVRFDIKPEMIG